LIWAIGGNGHTTAIFQPVTGVPKWEMRKAFYFTIVFISYNLKVKKIS
jgi:hypothetical protein